MRAAVINTGTEILLGDVVNTHLTFIARGLLLLGLRVGEHRTVPDGPAIRETLHEICPRADIVFVTGGLGPTTDDLTREVVAEMLGLPLVENSAVRAAIANRLSLRRIPVTNRIWRQAQVPSGAEVLPNENGTAPGLYLRANINGSICSPHIFLLPGPPRELEPMFQQSVIPILRPLAGKQQEFIVRKFRLAIIGESIVEKKVGRKILAIPGLELGYCARPGEVELRLIGAPAVVARAQKIVEKELAASICSTADESLAEVIVRLLRARKETLAIAESCTGGLLMNQITNFAGASQVFRAGYVTYSNEEKTRALGVSSQSLKMFGAVSDQVAREMAVGARKIASATHSIATTGIAGPAGGTSEKPVGTGFVAIASENQNTLSQRFFFPSDRATFKQLIAQNAFNLLRLRLVE